VRAGLSHQRDAERDGSEPIQPARATIDRRSPYRMRRGATMSRNSRIIALVIGVSVLLVFACTKASKESVAAPARSDLPESFYLSKAPIGAKNVGEVLETAKPGETVVVTGRVGGAKDVFVEGVAWFSFVDTSLKPCNVEGPMPNCPTPWDNCCTAPEELARKKLSIEVSDGKKPVRQNVRGFHGLDHNAIVTVVGEFAKDEAGNATVRASGIHVHP
jgi:hypothetical protein